MKKRYIVLGALVLGLALIALGLGAARRGVVGDDRRDFAAETFRGAAETRYVQLSLYPKEEKHLTPDGMMAVKNALEASLTADGISPRGSYLLVGSGETAVTLARESAMADGMTSINTTDATATVYFGSWFGLHPTVPQSGGFVDAGETGQGYCVIDEYTAARLFGSVDVCGLDITVNGFMYTVTAVCWLVDVGNDVGYGECLSGPGDTKQCLCGKSLAHALGQLCDGLRLVTGGLVSGCQFEFVHFLFLGAAIFGKIFEINKIFLFTLQLY